MHTKKDRGRRRQQKPKGLRKPLKVLGKHQGKRLSEQQTLAVRLMNALNVIQGKNNYIADLEARMSTTESQLANVQAKFAQSQAVTMQRNNQPEGQAIEDLAKR